MLIFETVEAMQTWALTQKRSGKRLGLVPTMGYLHEGHLSLIAEARKHAECVVVSIFVNPIQFGPNEDFAAYPRNEARDLELCKQAGAAAVFLPTPAVMYAPDASVYVEETALQHGLCGERRPGHFRGVCTVVAKLFNCALPDVAVFGQKDFQQAAIIRRMVRDLNFPIQIIVAPTVREADGLAMSSRNVYLNPDERLRALGLSRALQAVSERVAAGGAATAEVKALMEKVLVEHGLRMDYAEIVDAETLKAVEQTMPGNVGLIAAFCGKTRLIDNRIL